MSCTETTMETEHDRLRQMRIKRGFKSATAAARTYGWNVNTYRSHENGARGITPDEALKYSLVFGFDLGWLYKGGATLKSKGISKTPDVAEQRIPRLSWDFLRHYGGVEKAMNMATDYSSLPQHMKLSLPSFSMGVEGDSMKNQPGVLPSFNPGDELIFSTSEKIRPGDFVLAEILDENTIVFRQYRERGRNGSNFMTYELAPLNPAFETRLVTAPTQARLVAKMTHRIESFI
jgi:SOS-response transcriptional repressor LexA